MKPRELNRDVARLVKKYKEAENTPEYYDKELPEIKAEWKRLWYADRKANDFNIKSLKAMIRLNVIIRTIPLYHIGLDFEL